ncbi:SNF5-domain-containing protein [Aureobasidium pullulans]|uniref:SNF5-domain-containing protein n=1 Tax=Aureobasidium pullulans TaxID=5580 RepID=A0A4S9TBD7_AURPU|nr:SNF5-domain-containing protein [Aureobasidium pullulans]
MSAFSLSRTESPQAFVSSFAPRVRTYQNSLLTPALQPQNAIAPLRTTKRGTTAINYSEDLETDSLVEDSDAPRRPTGLRSLRQNESQTTVTTGAVQSTELTNPVDVQGIWREWMGKPKKAMTERQVMLQAQLPLNLVPIRIDLSVNPFQPEAPLPKPNNARELGVDENSPAYKAPDMTPEFRIKDSFLWNLHESLMTPDQFAKVFVDELDFPLERRPALALQVSQQIRTQLEEHAAVVMHPLFNPTPTTDTRPISTRPPLSREVSSTPFANTPAAQQPQANGVNTPNVAQTPLPNDANVSAVAQPLPPSSVHSPDDAYRCIISLSINLMNRLYTDKFEWSLMHPPGFPEIFAKQTCADLGLSGEWVPAMAHAIYEAVLKLKKDYCENNGSLLGVIGSGVDAWGQIDNEAAEVHGDGALAIGEAAGWRFDNEDLGAEWQPRVEVLSKEEIEKREGDRERQIRRMRRETAARATNAGFAPPAALGNDYFGTPAGAGEEERMGRGERSKKKRRFRSLSPTGRETPDFTAAFGGEQGKLTESERPVWQCNHCRIGGSAVWAVRDGPQGPRTLCNNCGLLYGRDKRLPPWAKDLYLIEQPKPSRPDPPPHSQHHTPMPHTPSGFVPNIHRLQPSQNALHASSHSPHLRQQLSDMPDVYAATVRGGGPSMFEDYAVEGEDLDWTKVTDPRERKRLQNIINGRKYRERRLAAEAAAAVHSGASPAPMR